MTIHPDDVAALRHLDLGLMNREKPPRVLDDHDLADIITVLDAARRKRLPANTAILIADLRGDADGLFPRDPADSDYWRAADLLEYQALRIADLTQSLADATARAEKAKMEVIRLDDMWRSSEERRRTAEDRDHD